MIVSFLEIWIAVHLATAVPGLETPEAIATRLGLSVDQVTQVLKALESMDLVRVSDKGYHFGKGSLHLSEYSPWVFFHHSNWRQKALLDVQLRKKDSVHYTNVLTLTSHDCDRIRALLLDSIEKIMNIAIPSDPRELVCLNLDFFRV